MPSLNPKGWWRKTPCNRTIWHPDLKVLVYSIQFRLCYMSPSNNTKKHRKNDHHVQPLKVRVKNPPGKKKGTVKLQPIEEHLRWRDSIQKLALDHNLPKCSKAPPTSTARPRRGRFFTIPTFSPGTSCGVLVYFTYQLYKNIQKNSTLHWVFGVVWFCLNTQKHG